jgi:hypothetical protein
MGASPGFRMPKMGCLDDDALVDQEGQQDMDTTEAQGFGAMQCMYLPKSHIS